MCSIINHEYAEPPSGEVVTRLGHCPCFAGRQSLFLIEPICWFCKFAVFDLFSDKLPEYGMCKHPEEKRKCENNMKK